jgi:hypothetical protein
MRDRQLTGKVLTAAMLLGVLTLFGSERAVVAQEKKEPPTVKSGTVVGLVTAKTEKSIDVKADGEEKARTYVPNWVGGAPAQGGGPDKEMLKVIKEVKVGSRVRLEWKFEERARVVKLEILKPPAEKDK